jgi:hypothetical protein
MNLEALATGTPVATIAHAAPHLSGRQIVPGLAIITVLLLALVIWFGPRDRDQDPGDSPTADRPVHATDLGDPPKDDAGAVPGQEARSVAFQPDIPL